MPSVQCHFPPPLFNTHLFQLDTVSGHFFDRCVHGISGFMECVCLPVCWRAEFAVCGSFTFGLLYTCTLNILN